jgi:hypothetical protein
MLSIRKSTTKYKDKKKQKLVLYLSFLDIENYALEKYSSQSKCFDHGSIWEQYIDQCRKKRRITPQAAGCYQVFI